MRILQVLFGVKGRLDRRGYGALVLAWLLTVAIVQRFIIGLPDFTTSGRLIDMMWDGELAWASAVDAAIHQTEIWWPRYVAFGGLLALMFASFMALSARRLHDMGRPAGFAWISVLPFLGPQALFYVLVLLPGDTAENRFGPARAPNPPQAETNSPVADPI